ncbi:hypothetical protein GCM10010254_10680 [Streptomyces chromofuscus]|nr:hypothetical protein GCM10010254_10680 [Streptomyces chromofuscus]
MIYFHETSAASVLDPVPEWCTLTAPEASENLGKGLKDSRLPTPVSPNQNVRVVAFGQVEGKVLQPPITRQVKF